MGGADSLLICAVYPIRTRMESLRIANFGTRPKGGAERADTSHTNVGHQIWRGSHNRSTRTRTRHRPCIEGIQPHFTVPDFARPSSRWRKFAGKLVWMCGPVGQFRTTCSSCTCTWSALAPLGVYKTADTSGEMMHLTTPRMVSGTRFRDSISNMSVRCSSSHQPQNYSSKR